ncbi:Voltage-gated hydrogen channel 1 [Taenia crassiceps]|uniref:Voltage-gated hydrogen channel 1 n=1 Tax=Taenia crassiceps TaxID=6207 RepID=A0ABR4Q1H9_9CEST
MGEQHMANQSREEGDEEEEEEEKGEEVEVEAVEAAEVVEEVVVEEEAKKNRRNRSIWCHCALGCIPVKFTTYFLILCMTSKALDSMFVPVCGVKPSKNGRIGYKCTLYPGWISTRRFLRQMQKDNIDCALLQQEACHRNEVKFAKGKLKSRVLHLMRGPVIQLLMCSLVLLDALIVTAEIILEIHAVKAEKKIFEYERSHMNHKMYRYYCTSHIDPESVFTPTTREACCQRPVNRSGVAFEAIPSPFALCCLARGGSDCGGTGGPARGRLFTVYHSVSAPPSDQMSMHCSHLTCCLSQLGRLMQSPLEAMGESGSCHFFHTIACILHFLSILILCIFVIQLAVKVVCMGRAFFRLKFEIVDGIIIIISLIADGIFVYIASEEITLIIVFLLWRIVRVVNSLLMYEKQRNEFRIQLQKRARRMSELKVEALNGKVILLEKHIDNLESMCVELGVPREQLLFCRPTISKSGKEVTKNAIRSMVFLTSEIITQFAVGVNPKTRETSPNIGGSCSALGATTSSSASAPPAIEYRPSERTSNPSSSINPSPSSSPPLWTKLEPS